MLILTSLLAHENAKNVVYGLIPSLCKLAGQEKWWEVQAQLLSFSGTFIASIGSIEPTAELSRQVESCIDLVLDMIRVLLHVHSSTAVREWGLHALAGALHFGEPISTLFLDVLITLEEPKRLFLLGFSEAPIGNQQLMLLGMPSSTGLDFVLESMTSRWSPLNVARAVETTVRLNRLDRLQPEHMEVLNACVSSALELMPGRELQGEWLELYSALVDYIFVAICDPHCVNNAVAIVLNFVYYSSLHELVLQENRFVGILRLLYPLEGSGNTKCQVAIESFFKELFASKGSRSYDRAVTGLLGQFWRSFPTQFEKSALHKMLNDFTNLMKK